MSREEDPRAPSPGPGPRWRRWRSYVFEVAEASMAPTFLPGDRIRVDPRAFRDRPPGPGDIVVLGDPERPGRRLLKRVLAGPGDSVFRDGDRFVAGTPGAAPPGELVVGPLEDAVFVIGDAPSESRDSRAFGPVALSEILGRPWFRTDPPGRRGPLGP